MELFYVYPIAQIQYETLVTDALISDSFSVQMQRLYPQHQNHHGNHTYRHTFLAISAELKDRIGMGNELPSHSEAHPCTANLKLRVEAFLITAEAVLLAPFTTTKIIMYLFKEHA